MTPSAMGGDSSRKYRSILSAPKYITSCTYCAWGIFSDHAYLWRGGDGLVHKDCDNPRGSVENKSTT